MTQINLLPWREEARKIQKLQFTTLIIVSILTSLLIILIFHVRMIAQANEQQQINNLLITAINAEHTEFNLMSGKDAEKVSISSQLQFIINRYKESYQAVSVLNELTELVPTNIVLSQIKHHGKEIVLTGKASTDEDVSLFMNDVTKSTYFTQPVLSSINTEDNNKLNQHTFQMVFEVKDTKRK